MSVQRDTRKTITRSVNNNARAFEKYPVQFQLMFVQYINWIIVKLFTSNFDSKEDKNLEQWTSYSAIL